MQKMNIYAKIIQYSYFVFAKYYYLCQTVYCALFIAETH